MASLCPLITKRDRESAAAGRQGALTGSVFPLSWICLPQVPQHSIPQAGAGVVWHP